MESMLPRRSKNLPNIVAMLRIFFRPTTAKEGRVVDTGDLGDCTVLKSFFATPEF